MKVLLLLLVPLAIGVATAAFEPWTNKADNTVELELVSKAEKNGDVVGTFRMRDGRTAEIAAADLSEGSADKLRDWQPEATGATPPPSVFDDILAGNLLKLEGKRLKRFKDLEAPTKYYLFYYTASWCGPCHKFTPNLVKFYKENKNDEFEVILITADSDEESMEDYAAEMGMPWPQLKMAKVGKFRKEFRHPGGGIPNLVLTNLDGELLKTSYVGKDYVGPYVVMNHLKGLLQD